MAKVSCPAMHGLSTSQGALYCGFPCVQDSQLHQAVVCILGFAAMHCLPHLCVTAMLLASLCCVLLDDILQKQKVDYLNLPQPSRYEDIQREGMSESHMVQTTIQHSARVG